MNIQHCCIGHVVGCMSEMRVADFTRATTVYQCWGTVSKSSFTPLERVKIALRSKETKKQMI